MKEIPLHLQPATETTELAIASYYPVTGNNNGQRVSGQSPPHCPRCPSFAKLPGYPGIAPGLTVRDKPGYFPYLTLKGGSLRKVKLIGKDYPVTAEVDPEALYQVIEEAGRPDGLAYPITQ